MSDVTENLQALIQSMKDSDDYQRYRKLEEELNRTPETKAKINAYRRRSYDMQNSGRDLFDETDHVLHEYRDLYTDPIAVDYLDAENAVCRMLQRVIDAINREVSVELPDTE